MSATSTTENHEEWTTNQKEIMKAYQTSQYQDKNKRKFEVPVHPDGRKEAFDVYKIPVQHLKYNFLNVRIKAELRKKQRELGRTFNPASNDDQKIVEKILLTSKFYSEQATKNITDNIRDIGQTDPAWVAEDGTVWNGNRRLAIRNNLAQTPGETNIQQWKEVDVIFLPTGWKTKRLKMLERKEQMQRGYKENYGKVQDYLEIRDSVNDPEWSLAEVVDSFNNEYDADEIQEICDLMDFIDEWLVLNDKPEDYVYIHEHGGIQMFDDLYGIYKKELKTFQNDPADPTPDLIKQSGFWLLSKPGATFKDARKLRDILSKQKSRKNFLDNSVVVNNPQETTGLPTQEQATKELEVFTRSSAIYETIKNDPETVIKNTESSLNNLSNDRVKAIPNNSEIQKTIDRIITRLKEIKDLVRDANN